VLLDSVLPEFDVAKRHRISIRATRQRVFDAVVRYDFRESRVTQVLMALRGYGTRLRRANAQAPATLRESLARFGFTPLAEAPGEEIVFGLVGQFWRPSGGLRSLTAAEFATFREPGFAKAAWNLLCRPTEDPAVTELSTETRVTCYGDAAKRKFLLYWRVVERFSGLIRWSLLHGVKRAAERG
jgi:hypothetical protein